MLIYKEEWDISVDLELQSKLVLKAFANNPYRLYLKIPWKPCLLPFHFLPLYMYASFVCLSHQIPTKSFEVCDRYAKIWLMIFFFASNCTFKWNVCMSSFSYQHPKETGTRINEMFIWRTKVSSVQILFFFFVLVLQVSKLLILV